MPVVIEQIDTEISPEPRAEPAAPEPQSVASLQAELVEKVRRELMLREARRLRLLAD